MTTTPDTHASTRDLSVGRVGYAFMGAAHSHAWRTAPRFFDLPLRPRMRAVAGRDPQGVRAAADRLGWESTETSWQALVERDDIDLVDVCTPGHTHAEGRLGTLHHVRAQYLQDWIVDPQAPLSWRLEKDKAGSGSLGDIGAHIIDITQYITGDTISRVTGRLHTFVDERPQNFAQHVAR